MFNIGAFPGGDFTASFRDMIFPEFRGGRYNPSGGGDGLGEPGYEGRTANESKPPGWTPNPLAWDPFSRTPGGDPFYSALNTAARQTQEPWTIKSKTSASRGLLAQYSPFATDAPSSPRLMMTQPITILAGQTRIDQVRLFGGDLYNHYRVIIDGVTWDAYVKAGVTEPDGVILMRDPDSAAADSPGATDAPPTQPPRSATPLEIPSPASTPGSFAKSTGSAVPGARSGAAAPTHAEEISRLTEMMLYRDLAQSDYSTDAINRLNAYYEDKFPLSGGNLRALTLNRAAVFATAFGGQWRQGDYLSSIGNGVVGLLDYAGATIAGESREQTAENLVQGILIGAVLGAVFGALRGLGGASGRGAASRAAGDTGGTLEPQLGGTLEPQLGGTLKPQLGGMLKPQLGGTLKPQLKSALPPESSETSFANLIDNSEFSNHPAIIDRLSRARQFDVGGYKSLTAKGEYGRPWDGLDSDEALQNAFVRYLKDIGRYDPLLADNPAIALKPELHRQIGNLTSSQMQGRLAADVLRFHIEQMRGFTPDFVLEVLERESLKFIELHGF